MSIQRINPGRRLSQAVLHRDTVYVAGIVADDTSADVVGQTSQILAKLERLLAEAGTDKSRLLSATVWLADAGSYDEMNSVWDAWVPTGAAPARACVESKLAKSEYRVEVAAIAARDAAG
ncbi:MAG TPA: RidA family protein [Candidatus Eremiobacteraceae bacterium]|nr:RidA family protein [Candidatus Eremiobacteraceae bacterium]